MYADNARYSPDEGGNDVALLLDWENLKIHFTSRESEPDLAALKGMAGQYGRVVLARAYADWEAPAFQSVQDSSRLYREGIEPVYVAAREGLTESDSERRWDTLSKLMADALEISFMNPRIKTFILGTGEAQLSHLIQSLRSRGNRVILLGISGVSSERMVDSADEFLFCDQTESGRRENYARPPRQEPFTDLESVVEELVGLVREQREENRYPLLSWLGHQMRRRHPGFSPHVFGFEKFKDLIRYAEQQGALKIVTQGLVDWALLPEDETPEEPLSAYSYNEENGGSPAQEGFENRQRPVGYRGGYGSDELVGDYDEVFDDIIRTAYEIECDDRYAFMTPGFLGQCLWRKGHWDPETLPPGASPASGLLKGLRAGQIRKLIDMGVEDGLLLSHMRYDAATGKTFPVIKLSERSARVQKVVSESKRGPGRFNADASGSGYENN